MRARRPRPTGRNRSIPVIGRLEECFLCGGGRVFRVFGRATVCPFCGGRGRIPVLTIVGRC